VKGAAGLSNQVAAATAPQIESSRKTKCRMSILAIRHPALQSMCSKD
jgi:hypothetical protein